MNSIYKHPIWNKRKHMSLAKRGPRKIMLQRKTQSSESPLQQRKSKTKPKTSLKIMAKLSFPLLRRMISWSRGFWQQLRPEIMLLLWTLFVRRSVRLTLLPTSAHYGLMRKICSLRRLVFYQEFFSRDIAYRTSLTRVLPTSRATSNIAIDWSKLYESPNSSLASRCSEQRTDSILSTCSYFSSLLHLCFDLWECFHINDIQHARLPSSI
jgi:hypothetical protein